MSEPYERWTGDYDPSTGWMTSKMERRYGWRRIGHAFRMLRYGRIEFGIAYKSYGDEATGVAFDAIYLSIGPRR